LVVFQRGLGAVVRGIQVCPKMRQKKFMGAFF